MININKVHDAMQAAPMDDQKYRQSRAAIEEVFKQILERDQPTDTELLGCEFDEF